MTRATFRPRLAAALIGVTLGILSGSYLALAQTNGNNGSYSPTTTGTNTWNGSQRFTGATTSTIATSGVTIGTSSGLPDGQWVNSGGGTNSKVWDCYADTTTWHCRIINDAFNSAQDWIQVVRSGLTVTSVTIPQGTFVPAAGVLLPVTTVASLPSCTTGTKGLLYAVSDASSPTYNATLTGSSTTFALAACNGSAWVAH